MHTNSSETKLTIGSVCFICNHDSTKMLLLKRNRNPMQGKYTGVGGKTSYMEDIRSSCFREVQEETGLDIFELCLKGIVKTIAQDGLSSWILFVYIGTAEQTELNHCDEGDLEWVDISLLFSY